MRYSTSCHLLLGLFGLTSRMSSVNAVGNASAGACIELASTLRNNTILPWQSTYVSLATDNWSQTAWANPKCVFQPRSAREVQQALRIFTRRQVPFAIRSGGHMPSPLAANINDGILIDMSLFTGINYDPGNHMATIGTGQIWRNVYNHLEHYNVTVVGGRVLEVGVGGLILGCGLSYLSDLYGLACDNVVNYEVVLANGSIVNANANFNTDLWWALKGGGNNFGVVTAFSLSTHPIHEVWGGVKIYSYNNTPAVLSAMSQYQSEPNKDPYANLITQVFTTNSSIGVVLTMVYLKPEVAPSAFKPFYSIPTVLDTTKIQTFSQVMGGQSVPAIPRFDWFTTTFKPSNSLYQHLNNIITTAPELKTLTSVTAGALALAFQPISASVVHAGNARGGNALGLQPVNQTWFALDTSHFFPTDDAVAHNATRGIHERIETLTRSNGSYLPYQFMNDASYDQDVLAHYGAANLRRLRDVQARYDPDLVFQKLVPGGFKLR